MAQLKISEKKELLGKLAQTLQEKIIKPLGGNGEVKIHALKDRQNLSHDHFYRGVSTKHNVAKFYQKIMPEASQVMITFANDVPLDFAAKDIEIRYGKRVDSVIKALLLHDDEKPVAAIFGLSEGVLASMSEGKFSKETFSKALLEHVNYNSFNETVLKNKGNFNTKYKTFIGAARNSEGQVVLAFPNLSSEIYSMRKSFNDETLKLTHELFENAGFPLEKFGKPNFSSDNLLLKFSNVYELGKPEQIKFVDTLKQYEGFIEKRIKDGKNFDFSQFLNKALKIQNLEELRQTNGYVLEAAIFDNEAQKQGLKQYLENVAIELLEKKYAKATQQTVKTGLEIVPLKSLEIQKQKIFKGISEDLLKINNQGNLIIAEKFVSSLMNHKNVTELVDGLKGAKLVEPAKQTGRA